jgi:hypothetical protein
MECHQKANAKRCTCTYPGCPRHGACCECLAYHKAKRQLPGCFFPAEVEKTWERSFEAFARLVGERRV